MKLAIWTLMGLLAATPVLAQVTVTVVRASHKDDRVDVSYPQTGIAAIDTPLKGFADGLTFPSTFDRDGVTFEAKSMKASGVVYRNDAEIFGVQMESRTFYGSVGGTTVGRHTYTFLQPDGWRVYLPELVDGPRGMKKISELAKAEIRHAFSRGAGLTRDVLGGMELGASPNVLQFADFRWLPGELILNFESGFDDLSVHIPRQAFADVVRADPRAPSPSFDCTKARRTTEKTVCGNVELARTDRELAIRYAARIVHYQLAWARSSSPHHAAEGRAALAQLVRDQVAWRKARDRQCADGEAPCLAASYKKRLAEL